jgi:chromosomal replication initiator protein DnaA
MILPKGTVESTRQGGEGKVRETMTELVRSSFTGYLLIQGHKENENGTRDPVTGQLVLREGKPVLCESIIDKTSEKGDGALFTFLTVMMDPQTKIEVHGKIDVGPPLAFFKECRMNKSIDLDGFLKSYRKHQDDLRKRNEERAEQEKRRKQMIKDMEDWASAGYQIGPMDEKRAMPYQDLMECYGGISARINRSREIVKWLSSIKDIDLTEQVEKLKAMTVRIDDMQAMEASVKSLQSSLDMIVEKRAGIMKWVSLWKEEGYTTGYVEEKLNGPLEAAWDATIFFMDSIQKLKEYREELDTISRTEEAKVFSKEIAEIEFLLNDPNEIPNAERLLSSLKEMMEKERAAKQSLMNEAQMYKAKGFVIKGLVDHFNERSEAFSKRYESFKGGIARIAEIGSILSKLDRRDLSVEIETLKSSMKDPFKTDSYGTTLKEIEGRIGDLAKERAKIRKRTDDLKSKGYSMDPLEALFNGPIDPLKKGLSEIEKKIEKLNEIAKELSTLDRRWQEERVSELEGLLKQPEKLAEARDVIGRIKARISEREQLREKVKHDLTRWRSEGFMVKGLEDVIEDDMSAFSMVHEDIKKRITNSRELLKELDSTNTKFFSGEAGELRSLIKDPFSLDRAKQMLSELKAKVTFDAQRRSDLKKRLEELKRTGFKTDSLKDILETPSTALEDRISDMDDTVNMLKAASSEIDKWDSLERSWLHSGIEELRKHLMDIGDGKGAMAHHSDLKEKIVLNANNRQEMRERVKVWKEAGYNVTSLEKKMDRPIQELTQMFQETLDQVVKLEELQERFDSLEVKHFKKEAEDLEFKMNDPGLVKEIEEELNRLDNQIGEDREKRSAIVNKIDSLIGAGFVGAEKLRPFLDRDMSILELEVKNFEKETQMFLKFMESTGYKPHTPPPIGDRAPPATVQQAHINDYPLDRERTISSFLVGNSNRFAVKAAEAVIQKPGETYNPLCIIAGSGLGKTHLLNAVGAGIIEKHPKKKVILAPANKFVTDLKNAQSEDGMKAFRKYYGSSDALLLDDFEDISSDHKALSEIESMFDSMTKHKKQIVLASSCPPHKMAMVPERMRSMLDSGLVVDIKMPSDDIKKKLVISSAKSAGITLQENMIDHICGTVEADIRTMDMLVKRIKVHSEMEKRQIDTAMIDEVASEMLGPIRSMERTAQPQREVLTDYEGPVKHMEPASFMCNACNSSVPGDSTVCPNCGASFEDSVYQCPKCNAEVPTGVGKCPNCNTEFAL